MNGLIELNSEKALKFGFTKDKFFGWLWEDGDAIWISFIQSLNPGKGNLKALMDNIEKSGYKIIVPEPSNRMIEICRKRDLKPMNIITPDSGESVFVMTNIK